MNIEEKDNENPDPIRLFIHSYGGDIEQALFSVIWLNQVEFRLSQLEWALQCRQVF